MSGLGDTIAKLSRGWPQAADMMPVQATSLLRPLTDFGSNPGQLRGWLFVPDALSSDAALVVVLHGCTQTASGYDLGAGWSALAAEAGFAVLCPEQQRANNANLCFNWFERGDVARGQGEVLSIRQMVAAMIDRRGLDPARVFVTGLSAGGAMTAALLAAYPDVFAGGAIIAGLPFETASGVPEALQRMRVAGPVRTANLRERLVAATGHADAFPSVSIWHGDADHIVDASNAAASVEQWRAIHGVDAPAVDERIGSHARRVWRDSAGRDVIESWTIAGMGHGTPLATFGAEACGKAGPHMLEAGISSTRRIARFWGLLDGSATTGAAPAAAVPSAANVPAEVIPESESERWKPGAGEASHTADRGPQVGKDAGGGFERNGDRPAPGWPAGPGAIDPGAVIERALRAAGLMK